MVAELKVINGRIRAIGKGEATFRQEMGNISRELIEYVPITGDIDAVNRLMAVLTPKNFETAKQFFSHFLAHQFKDGKFGKKSTNKELVRKRIDLVKDFIAVEENNIWSWMKDKADKEPKPRKPKDYAGEIEKVIAKSLNEGDDEHINPAIALRAAIIGFIKSGVALDQLMNEFGQAMEQAVADPRQLVNADVENKEDKAAA